MIERWTNGCILPFPKKGDLGLAKNYRGITLTSIVAKIYNALIRNRKEPKIDNILRKNKNGFRRNRSTTSQILTIRRILEGLRSKNLLATLLFVDFAKAFDSIHRGKMEQILLAYGLQKETVAAIMILYRNTKVKVRSPDGDTEYFDIVAGVLQGDTLAPYLFIICLDYVLRTSIDKICWRSKDELISDVLQWTPTYGYAKAGRPARTYIQQLCEDTGCNPVDLPEVMNDREKGQGYPCWRRDMMMMIFVKDTTIKIIKI